MNLYTIMFAILSMFAQPSTQTQPLDALGHPPAAISSQTAPQLRSPVDNQQELTGATINLSDYTFAQLMWCLALNYCPEPGTPIDWGVQQGIANGAVN